MIKSGPLNILVLHRLGDPETWRESMLEKELCLPKFAPEHRYVVHDFWLPLPDYVNRISFDAVILTQTFLGARADRVMRQELLDKYLPLIKKDFFKIGLPQDDYTCSAILDDWLMDWRVHLTYPVCVNDWSTLYPRYSVFGRLKQGFTGYISEALLDRSAVRSALQSRPIDVAYRAASLSPEFGRLGQVKVEYGSRFEKAAEGLGFTMDVSTHPKDAILGQHWYSFIEKTRCMLGTNSGSSLLDPDGEIRKCVFKYKLRHPQADFSEVEAACFPKLDGRHEFTAISPRNLECALFGTVQILAPGSYGGFMEPWQDYIPLQPDMSNFADVAPLLRDSGFLQAMADRCREKILSYKELRYSHHVADLIEEIRANTRITDAERERSVPLIHRYQDEAVRSTDTYWRKRRLKTRAMQMLGDVGLRRAKYFIKDLLDV